MSINDSVSYNDIGTQGELGFGTGVANPDIVPSWLRPGIGTTIIGHANYGRYEDNNCIRWEFKPDHWIRKGSPDSPRYEVYGDAATDILKFSSYPDEEAAALDGYRLNKAFFCSEEGRISAWDINS